MDEQRIDNLARTIGSGASRRRLLKGAVAAGGAALLGLATGRRPAAAAPCGPGRQKCGGACIPKGHECVKGGGPPHGSPPGQNP